jgi:hypothetical protein
MTGQRMRIAVLVVYILGPCVAVGVAWSTWLAPGRHGAADLESAPDALWAALHTGDTATVRSRCTARGWSELTRGGTAKEALRIWQGIGPGFRDLGDWHWLWKKADAARGEGATGLYCWTFVKGPSGWLLDRSGHE